VKFCGCKRNDKSRDSRSTIGLLDGLLLGESRAEGFERFEGLEAAGVEAAGVEAEAEAAELSELHMVTI
jgi:hypothetical protein